MDRYGQDLVPCGTLGLVEIVYVDCTDRKYEPNMTDLNRSSVELKTDLNRMFLC